MLKVSFETMLNTLIYVNDLYFNETINLCRPNKLDCLGFCININPLHSIGECLLIIKHCNVFERIAKNSFLLLILTAKISTYKCINSYTGKYLKHYLCYRYEMEVSDIHVIRNMQKENRKLDRAVERLYIAYIYAKRFAYFKCQFI